MNVRSRALVATMLVASVGTLVVVRRNPSEPPRRETPLTIHLRTSEYKLRKRALRAVRPIYPVETLISRTEGVVVMEVSLDATGKVVGVKALEAPSSELADSVRAAISEWQFRGGGEKHRISHGKLTFYCWYEGNRGVVRYPGESGIPVSFASSSVRFPSEGKPALAGEPVGAGSVRLQGGMP